MPHSSIVHVKNAAHIRDDNPLSVKSLHRDYVDKLRHAGHHIRKEYVLDHEDQD